MTLADLKNKHAGATIWITGRGPSLTEFPWQALNGRLSIAHNDSARSYEPMYWYVTDGIVFQRCPEPLNREDLTIIAGTRCKNWLQSHAHTLLVDTCYFNRKLPEGEWIYSQYMGITGCLYLAHFMGAARAYLLGIDAWARKTQYYYDPRQHHPNRALEQHVNRWLDDERFVAQVHVDRHVPALHACADWLRRIGSDMEVINLSVDSQHDAFPRDDWRNWL